ncbi:MAG: LysR family transcriptional regulator [Parvularcula sp.]|jgi:DNA-binding transcriptional LysR family regulator|nr:LysR family transcriptional regulator [Parvularcula sp.]
MDTRRLRHFLTVYQLGSIGHAAETLPITQPALSKSIRHLEAELECELFERTPTGVVPTVFGEALAHYARQIAGEIESARARIAELRGGQTGEVRIGVGPSIAVNMMPMVTRRAQAERPGVRLEVREGLVDTIFPALRRGELDLVVGLWPRSLDRDFRVQTLLSDRIGVLAAADHPLAKRKASLSELANYPWALPPRSQRWRMTLDEFFLSEGLEPPRAQVESNSATYLKSLILSGDYLSYLPYQLVRSADQADRIVMLDADVPKLEPPVSVTYRDGAIRSPATAYVVGVFQTIGKELAAAV